MKAVCKGTEPSTLTRFRSYRPNASWDQMRDDTQSGGKQAYTAIRSQAVCDQGGLCAFCEIEIRDNDPLKWHVEHFHPKSDSTSSHNWALDWNNMLAVCNGGCDPFVCAPGFYMEPLKRNLSCDAHKDRMIQRGKLSLGCEGWILSPVHMIAFPNLFRIDLANGEIEPDEDACDEMASIRPNKHSSTLGLVRHSIEMLNLNCDRLCRERLTIIHRIERDINNQRKQGFRPEQGLANLAGKYYAKSPRWHRFFTTIRFRLGSAAEKYLQEIDYKC